MESKKINQLATELSPALDDLTIIGDPTTGISKKITLSQMASLFTGTVEEYANVAAFPLVGVADTIYIALDTNVLYRWNTGTSAYVELSPNIINSLVFSDANGFDGNISLVGSTATLTITTALTTGSVPFIGASGALLQDNANFFWDDTNNRLGLGTNAPTTALDAFGSGIIGRLNGTSTNNAFLGFASAGSNKWSIGNVQADHRFRIYNESTTSELISVLSTGEFGIGIANPTTKFHIDGGASALIANLDANVSVAKSISFRSDNSNRFNIEVSGTESGSNAGADFFIRRYSDAGALIDTPLTILRSSGNIGIGINNPAGKLDVYAGANQNLIFKAESANQSSLRFNEAGNGPRIFTDAATEEMRIQQQYTGTGFLTFYTGSTERLRVTKDGYLKASNAGNYIGSTGAYHELRQSAQSTASIVVSASNANFDNNVLAVGTVRTESSAFNLIAAYANDFNDLKFVVRGDGNVGIGLTPFSNTLSKSLDLVNGGGLFAASNNYYLTANAYFDSAWKYKATSGAAFININSGGDGSIGFVTAPSGTAGNTISFSQKMKINQGGSVFINTDSALAGSGTILHVFANDACTTLANNNTGQQVLLLWNKGTTSNNLFQEFATETGLTGRGSIDFNRAAGLVRYNTTSDANLKNIIGDSNLEKSINILNSTKIKEFSWKEDKTNKVQIGVIAQELYETYKGAVSVGSDEELLGTEDYKTWKVDKTAFTFHLIAGWQKHEEIIKNLEQRIKQLEAK